VANTLSPVPRLKFFDNNGAPMVGGQLFTYAAGTSTKLDTYVSAGGAANANPIELDFRGEANVWIPPNVAYKYVLAPPTDTDPPGSPIFTTDNIVNSQLLSLFGGVDTGIADQYVLTFTANFTAYEDGVVIFWIPANNNTGPSTVNVNGLGPVSILNQDGTPLIAGQIRANQVAQMMFYNGDFLLLSNVLLSGQFTATLTGMTTTVTAVVQYYISGNIASLSFLNQTLNKTGTSNSIAMKMTGIPAVLQTGAFQATQFCGGVIDNSLNKSAQVIMVSGELNFFLGFDGDTDFTGSGTKGLSKNWNLIYPLN
jgi:hypothetical protein